MDESPALLARIRGTAIVVSRAAGNAITEFPFGLIHDWLGAAFIAKARMNDVLTVLRECGSYKEFYWPAVIDLRPLALSDLKDRFSMLVTHRALLKQSALASIKLPPSFE